MRPKTQELLYGLLWAGEMITRPTFRNLTSSYEEWAYRNGFMRELAELERLKFLEKRGLGPDERVFRLTDKGRLQALGGRDPEMRWARKWDGFWRVALFDLPVSDNSQRDRLRYYLLNHGFGRLQRSVWITPDPLTEEQHTMGRSKAKVKSLMFFVCRPGAGETTEQIVSAAWNFERINDLYEGYLGVVARRPKARLSDESSAKAFQAWAAAEREAWLAAIERDPLLPATLLPPGYRGREAWAERKRVLKQAGAQMRSFSATFG